MSILNIAKNILGYIVIGTIFIGFIGIFVYFIYNLFFEKPEPYIPKKEKWCAEIQYFNSSKKMLENSYSEVFVKDDTLLMLYINGETWSKKDFLDSGEMIENLTEVTVKNGEHFKIKLIDSGECRSKVKMDSIKNYLSDHETDEK